MVKRLLLILAIMLVLFAAFAHPAVAQTTAQNSAAGQQVIPVDLAKAGSGSLPLQIVVLLTLLSFIPAILS